MFQHHRLFIFIVCACATGVATADSFNFTILPTSTANQSVTVSYPLAGTFIGSYDATTNPTGTLTLPGYFGGSGNQPIAYTSIVRTIEKNNSIPAGNFAINVLNDTSFEISNLAMDLVNGTPGTLKTESVLTYSSFHTVAPTSIYPSVGAVTIPVATGDVSSATAVQTAPATGSLSRSTNSSPFTLLVVVPVEITSSGTLAGQPFVGTPTPGLLSLTGTLDIQETTATFSASSASTDPIGPLDPLPPLVSQPLDLPTVLPAGNTSHLLISGTFSQGTGESIFDTSLNAAGELAPIFADLNGDRVVDSADLGNLLLAFGSCPNCLEDLNQDTEVDSGDVGLMLLSMDQ